MGELNPFVQLSIKRPNIPRSFLTKKALLSFNYRKQGFKTLVNGTK